MTAADKAAALDTVRAYALSYTASLPNYTCTQSTRQVITKPSVLAGGPLGSAIRVDLLEEQLSYVNRREVRTLTKINEARPTAAQRTQIGTISRGEFASLLDTIFEPKSGADIRWDRSTRLEGRPVNVFAYFVPEPSGYTMVGSRSQLRVAFEGLVYADVRTGAVIQIEMKGTGIPPKSEYKSISLILQYKEAKVGGKEYLLPFRFNLRYEMAENGAIIGAEYKSYHRFDTDSTIRFDADPGDTVIARAQPGPAVLPEAEPVNNEISPVQLPEPLPQILVAPLKIDVIPVDLPKDQPPEPVFRTSTQLIQVSVIAQDKTGNPVTDLRRDEFQIFDNGAPQEIRLFRADHSDFQAPVAQAPGTFTNRTGTGGSSVLLFDRLFIDAGNSVFQHNVRARQKALEALKAIPPGDSIAIYSLSCSFQVVREFSTDRDSLLEKLNAYAPGPAPCADPSTPENAPDKAKEAMAEIAAQRQFDLGEFQFKVMADHLAGIPGRKNLIWVTSVFHLSPANVKRLVDANVAIYPVDAIGSMIGPPSAKKERYAPLIALAAMTGGLAIYDRDDFDAGIREALSDNRTSYELGFYPSPNDGASDDNAPVHRLNIHVTRPGVTLRYRTSYELKPPPPVSANPLHDLVEAMNRPVDATVIPLTALATRTGDQVNLSISLDLSSLDLQLSEGLWKGKAELIARFATADGLLAGSVSAKTVTFNLRQATYESMLRGDPYRTTSQLAIPAKATELKVLVGNLASGKIGTLTIRLSEIGPAPANVQ
jgi:VWFA-related protein